MFTDRITLTKSDASSQDYDASIRNSTSTVRTDATRSLDQPMGITISHEQTKDKKRTNSAVMLDKSVLDADEVTIGNARVLVKLSYDNEVISASDIEEMVDQVKEFLTSANIAKLLNREH